MPHPNNQTFLHLERNQTGSAILTLNRPTACNALNLEMIHALRTTLTALSEDHSIHSITLLGAGRHFCAGADLKWFQSIKTLPKAEAGSQLLELALLFEAMITCAKPIIAHVQGATRGGGLGLLACCDRVFADPDSNFQFTEIKIGLKPAIISPYILHSTQSAKAQALMQSGEQFSAQTAYSAGLVTEIKEANSVTNQQSIQKKFSPEAAKIVNHAARTTGVKTLLSLLLAV